MLCQFSFKNFMSYRGETTFDFQATSISEFDDSLIKNPKASSLLPVSAIYGPNGGGKSNLLKALSCVISLVVKPIADMGKNRAESIFQQAEAWTSFAFDADSQNEPTEFQIYFRTRGYEYRYYLALLRDVVIGESLHRKTIGGKKPAHIFSRDGSEVTLGPAVKGAAANVNPKMPLLTFLAVNYSFPVIEDVQDWFESCITRSYAYPYIDNQVILVADEREAEIKRKIVHALNNMDIDIADYRYDREENNIYIKRIVGGTEYEIPFWCESDGTKKLIASLPLFMFAIQEGRLIVVDELDAKLHPKLLRYIVSLFTNPEINKNGAQLIFTSHDVSIMKNTVFRRDEIWFVALDESHSSMIYSLYDIRREDNERINSTAAFDKQYLEGRYGADPYLKNILGGGDWV